MSSIYSDEELVLSVRNGEDAFAELYVRYYPKIKRYIDYKIASSRPEEREDIVQDILIKAWKGLPTFDASQRFSPWIYRIAHNEMANHVKFKQSKGTTSLEDLQEESHFDIPSADRTDKRTERLLRRENVNKILLQIDEKYRIPLIMMYVHAMSYEEIGAELALPVSTVGVRIQRAKKKFIALVK